MTDFTLYRGTTELWEKAVIEAQLPPQNISLITGSYMQKLAKDYSGNNNNNGLEDQIRSRIRTQPCSMLRSGKEIVLGQKPIPLMQLTAKEINKEIVERVGYESALGTPNFKSHFVPCGVNIGISNNFGHGACYRFKIQGKVYGSKIKDIEEYVNERNKLPSYIIPLFKGGSNEVLAYTGSLITSVILMSGQNIQYAVMNSLD